MILSFSISYFSECRIEWNSRNLDFLKGLHFMVIRGCCAFKKTEKLAFWMTMKLFSTNAVFNVGSLSESETWLLALKSN
jgi:hypothetical protein